MLKPSLSIIIPCYNCSGTLEEAVGSCFVQGLDNFEIVMVDDGSTDDTRVVMRELANKHPEIKLFYHDKNRGGGATRNTAIEKSAAEIIFCLDSDDILPLSTLLKMLAFMREKKCDGILFEETRFFFDKNIKKVEVVKNAVFDSAVELADLFKERTGFLTRVNFLYTKESCINSGGYPTDHGFDTQSFGLRFLMSGHRAYVCPGTFYFHRRSKKPRSYFARECANGKMSLNSYLMYEDALHLFSDDLIKGIFNYNVIEDSVLGSNNLYKYISDFFIKNGEQNSFAKNYKKFIKQSSLGVYVQGLQNHDRSDFSKKTIQAIYHHKNGLYYDALNEYSDLIALYPRMRLLYINMIRCLLCKNGLDMKSSNDHAFWVFQPEKNRSNFLLIASRVDRLLKKIWEK